MAVADSEAMAQDLESLDITACKDRILQLQAERERRKEFTERLQEKLKALNNELAARKEEADRSHKELQHEQDKNKKGIKGYDMDNEPSDQMRLLGDTKREEQIDKVRRLIEEQLQEKIQVRAQRNELGIRTYDETELMIEKPEAEQAREATNIDTVLVTWTMPNSDNHYNLSYRIDRYTTSRKLREDACLYWNLSEVEYILKTLDNSKVHDELTIQNSFRKEEDAHLILQQKTPKNTVVFEKEQTAIWPKAGKHFKRVAQKSNATMEDKSGASAQGEFHELMQQAVPGLYAFMTQRDRNVTGHLATIKLRHICLYLLLLIFSMGSFFCIRPPSAEYYARYGVYSSMTKSRLDSETGIVVPDFTQIQSVEEMWRWLTYTVSSELLTNTSSLRSYNYAMGQLEVRMQQVRAPSHAFCETNPSLPQDILCFAQRYDSTTAERGDIVPLQLGWLDCTNVSVCEVGVNNSINSTNGSLVTGNISLARVGAGRLDSQPWRFRTEEQQEASGMGTESAHYQSYDSSGYAVNYNLQYPLLNETYQAFRSDMQFLRMMNWVTRQTRMISVHFTLFNGNHDYWISNLYRLEFPANGIVKPSSDVDLFRPLEFAGSGRDIFTLDICRLAIVLYIATFLVYSEITNVRAAGQNARQYLLGPSGLADFGIVAIFVYIIIVRVILFGQFYGSKDRRVDVVAGKFSLTADSYLYKQHTMLEPVLLALTMFRLLSFLRINRHIFIIWTTVKDALRSYIMFFMLFVPILVGFVCLANAAWGFEREEYSSFSASLTSTLLDLYGMSFPVYTRLNPFTLFFSFLFFVATKLVFINSWVAVLVEVYQRTRVSCGFKPRSYDWKEYQYANWCLWWPFRKIYLSKIRPKIDKGPTKHEEED
mmetsp:Transcript_36409/g.79641  ORF Transcript_36409/g.79641 Transcript_36409/m.79641 type:complete len:880 (-) Transcript_36409:183-2822(-)